MYLLTLFLVPAILGLLGKLIFRKQVTWKEYALMEVISLAILSLGYGIAKTADLADEEIWNGLITGKSQVRVSCRHSYTCNCVPVTSVDSDGDVSVDIECDTCYEHPNDYEWRLSTNFGETITIDRVDRRGLQEPPRFTQAYLGEAVAVKKSYFNYVRKQPGIVLRTIEKVDVTKYPIPPYLLKVYDYYRLDRFLNVGYQEPAATVWNELLQKINGRLNPKKEVNLLVVAAKTDPQFEFALEEAWLAGKKNDLVVVLGVPQPPLISWVGVISWSVKDDFREDLKKEVLAIGNIDRRDEILDIIEKMIDQRFQRWPMSEIRLQMASLEPGRTATIVLYVIGILAQLGMLALFAVNDVFGDEYQDYSFR